ncbi:MAG TPA: nicotinate phosphoribosyltransferase [Steroidobacteraceae bacterium]|nr:nicotinate phosphoribosyltransferase [Steroidobacteraceae bacterium]
MKPVIPIIRSLLDTDLYKFTMWQVFLHAYPSNHAVYRFQCRNRPEYPLSELEADVEAQLDHLCSLTFTADELDYLAMLRYLKSDFIEFLRIFHFQRRFITVAVQGESLHITAAGPQIHSAGFEIFVLSIVNELYFRRFDPAAAAAEGRRRLLEKIALLREAGSRSNPSAAATRHPFVFFEFGTRRRFSRAWQQEVVATLQREVPQYLKGTSNVALAKELGLVPMGTMAHEYLQTFQAVGVQLKNFQKAALEAWVQEYRGDLGIALTDVVGMDAFLRDFDLYFAKLFDGQRHDSGDPFEWGEKALAHYRKLRIDPNTKRFVFSDGLDFPRSLALHEHFSGRVRCGFGIGTYLTNDVGITPLNIVMKLTECNGQPVAKLSDTPSKTLCSDPTFLAYLRQVFRA